MANINELETIEKPTWCPGCGNYNILISLKNAISNLKLDPSNVALFTGIGCSGKDCQWIRLYGFHTLHGRPLAVAEGAKFANNKLTVIATGGDGDSYGIGMGHFIHAMRRNIDITYLVHDNQVYGLTTGQASPTSEKGFITKSTPFGVIDEPVNPLTLALSGGATYVARGFAGDVAHLTKLIEGAIAHKGFAIVDILQPCVTFNYLNTFEWYRQRVYKLEEQNHDPKDKEKAYVKAQEWGKKIPIGLFYKIDKPTIEDQLPAIKEKPLVEHDIRNIDISKTIKEFI